MNFKKMRTIYVIALALLSLMPVQMKAEAKNSPSDPIENLNSADVEALANRVEEIKAMDKSNLTRPEKVQLRKELRSIKHKLDDGGVFISAGALLVVIIILLIILI